MFEDRQSLLEIEQELREHAAESPTLEQLRRQFAGLTNEQERQRLGRLIDYLRRQDQRQRI